MVPTVVRQMRAASGLSLRALARAAGLATSTVHRIEQGRLHPTVATLERMAEAAGMRLSIETHADYAGSLVGLALSIRDDIAQDDRSSAVRKAAELAHRFEHAGPEARQRMISAEPPDTGDPGWNAFVAALAEWLAVRAGVPTPEWAHRPDRYLGRGWWVTDLEGMRAWEYAGSPAAFQQRGVYLHRASLTNV
jgi:transcriptional regulator with XRE-family HTH domain